MSPSVAVTEKDARLLEALYKGERGVRGSYSAGHTFFQVAKQMLPHLTLGAIRTWINNYVPYVESKRRSYSRFPRSVSQFYSYNTRPGTSLYIDTAFFPKGFDFKLCVCIVDGASRFAYTYCAKKLSASVVIDALKWATGPGANDGKRLRVEKIFSDLGAEFRNLSVKEFVTGKLKAKQFFLRSQSKSFL